MNEQEQLLRHKEAAMLAFALGVAADAHQDQRDKLGQPYLLHVMRVILGCVTPEARVAAALHDVLEDTRATIPWGHFTSTIQAAIVCLTRGEHESYETYIERVATDAIAREVKIADLHDNLGRLHELDEETQARLRPRYEAALAHLVDVPSKAALPDDLKQEIIEQERRHLRWNDYYDRLRRMKEVYFRRPREALALRIMEYEREYELIEREAYRRGNSVGDWQRGVGLPEYERLEAARRVAQYARAALEAITERREHAISCFRDEVIKQFEHDAEAQKSDPA